MNPNAPGTPEGRLIGRLYEAGYLTAKEASDLLLAMLGYDLPIRDPR